MVEFICKSPDFLSSILYYNYKVPSIVLNSAQCIPQQYARVRAKWAEALTPVASKWP